MIDIESDRSSWYTFTVNDEKKTATLTMKTWPSFEMELRRIAKKLKRSLSQTSLLLLQRGYDAYLKDGKLLDEEDETIVDQPELPIVETEVADENEAVRRKSTRRRKQG